MIGMTEISTRRFAGGLTRLQFLGITCLFWVYVTLSNILYAYSMRTGMARVTNVSLFSAWDARLLQHVMLLPVLLVSFWASLRIQWRPLLLTLPLQLILGVVFAALAYPAIIVAQLTLGAPEWHEHAMGHVSEPWTDPFFLSLWMASFVSFLPTYGFGLALTTGLALYTRFRDSELRLAALEREWSSARLAALRMQLSPHTLFNLLHTIRGHIEWDPKGAQVMVVQLADLLRRLLNAGEHDFSKLGDELQFVEVVFGIAAAALRRSPDGDFSLRAGDTRRVGAEPDFATAGRKRRGPRIGGPSRSGDGAHCGAHGPGRADAVGVQHDRAGPVAG